MRDNGYSRVGGDVGEQERTTGDGAAQSRGRLRIHGDDLQFVEVELDPGETVIGEAGAMMFLESGITFETKMGDGAEPEQGLFGKLKDAGKRALAGESLFITHFTNTGRGKQLVAFSAEFPARSCRSTSTIWAARSSPRSSSSVGSSHVIWDLVVLRSGRVAKRLALPGTTTLASLAGLTVLAKPDTDRYISATMSPYAATPTNR